MTKSTTSGQVTAERHGDTITLTKRDNGPSTSYSAADIINLAHSIAVEGVLDKRSEA